MIFLLPFGHWSYCFGDTLHEMDTTTTYYHYLGGGGVGFETVLSFCTVTSIDVQIYASCSTRSSQTVSHPSTVLA